MNTLGCWRGKRPWKGDNGHLSPPCFYLFIFFCKVKKQCDRYYEPSMHAAFIDLFFLTPDNLFSTILSCHGLFECDTGDLLLPTANNY